MFIAYLSDCENFLILQSHNIVLVNHSSKNTPIVFKIQTAYVIQTA